METPNILNEVLSPKSGRDGKDIVPEQDPTTADLDAAATTARRVGEALDPPRLNAEMRRSMSGQARVHQGALSAVAARMLARSERVAKVAKLQPEAVKNLLLCETALGLLRLSAWPVTALALMVVRQTGPAIDGVLDEIDK